MFSYSAVGIYTWLKRLSAGFNSRFSKKLLNIKIDVYIFSNSLIPNIAGISRIDVGRILYESTHVIVNLSMQIVSEYGKQ